jgi:hypothetical protein
MKENPYEPPQTTSEGRSRWPLHGLNWAVLFVITAMLLFLLYGDSLMSWNEVRE